jgi:SAM-dependent methyltransferase
MTFFLIVFGVLLVCFAGVLAVGAPYLPTLGPQTKAALELINLRAGDTLLELGCGDGRVVVAAAKQGYRVVGYELNPLLFAFVWLRTLRYRRNVTIIWGNYWSKLWPEADAIFVFLLPKYMKKLDTRIEQYPVRPVKLVSFAFQIPGKKPTAKKDGVYLYSY